MDLIYAIILGAVQGITEFLPVSSTAHLTLVEHLLLGKGLPLAFDVLLHAGTLLALLIYFHEDIKLIFKGLSGKNHEGSNLGRMVAIGMVPTIVFGFLTKSSKEWAKDHLWVYGFGLLITSWMLYRANLKSAQNTGRALSSLGMQDALMIGAIQGFTMSLNGSSVFSRAGNFSLDKDGNLVDAVTGAFAQGYNNKLDANGRIIKDTAGLAILDKSLASLRVDPNVKSSPKQSTKAMMAGNLSASMKTGETVKSSIPVYDNLGLPHVLELSFTRSATANQYTLSGTIDGKSITLPAAATNVTFKTDGTIDTPLNFDIAASELNTALGAGSTAFDTTKDMNIVLAEPDRILNGITQFAGENSVNLVSQDGYAAGNLTGLTIDPTGKILGSFSNSQSEILGQIAVARFTNSSGLQKQGDNLFAVSPNSGLPNIGTAAEIFTSVKLIGGALEDSNVDLTEQFTDLISTQRGFEAAARTITISDQFLQEINQLKR